MTDAELQAIEERLAKATGSYWLPSLTDRPRHGELWGQVFSFTNGKRVTVATNVRRADKHLISAGRQDMPKLIAHIRQLEAELRGVRLGLEAAAKMKKLKLFVWRGVRTDYTDGLAVAMAQSAEEAVELLKKDGCGNDKSWDGTKLDGVEPDVYEEPAAAWVYGGG